MRWPRGKNGRVQAWERREGDAPVHPGDLRTGRGVVGVIGREKRRKKNLEISLGKIHRKTSGNGGGGVVGR